MQPQLHTASLSSGKRFRSMAVAVPPLSVRRKGATVLCGRRNPARAGRGAAAHRPRVSLDTHAASRRASKGVGRSSSFIITVIIRYRNKPAGDGRPTTNLNSYSPPRVLRARVLPWTQRGAMSGSRARGEQTSRLGQETSTRGVSKRAHVEDLRAPWGIFNCLGLSTPRKLPKPSKNDKVLLPFFLCVLHTSLPTVLEHFVLSLER